MRGCSHRASQTQTGLGPCTTTFTHLRKCVLPFAARNTISFFGRNGDGLCNSHLCFSEDNVARENGKAIERYAFHHMRTFTLLRKDWVSGYRYTYPLIASLKRPLNCHTKHKCSSRNINLHTRPLPGNEISRVFAHVTPIRLIENNQIVPAARVGDRRD